MPNPTDDVRGEPMPEADLRVLWEQAQERDPDGIVSKLAHTALVLYQWTEENYRWGLTQRWYREHFGIHDHPDEWPLDMTKRAHEFCRMVWEVQ